MFTTPADKLATVEDDEDDLLGGDFVNAPATGGSANGLDLDFESSFPAIDDRNEVRTCSLPMLPRLLSTVVK